MIQHVRIGFRDHILCPAGQPFSVHHRHGGKVPVVTDALLHHLHAFDKGKAGLRTLFPVALQGLKQLKFITPRTDPFFFHIASPFSISENRLHLPFDYTIFAFSRQ